MNELPSSVPRAYQSELFIQACQGNIIAVMGTGTGKTLIAINLIKWMATRGTDGGRHQVREHGSFTIIWIVIIMS